MDIFKKNSIDLLLCYNGFEASEKDQAEEQCKNILDKITTDLEKDVMNPQNVIKEYWCKENSKYIYNLDARHIFFFKSNGIDSSN